MTDMSCLKMNNKTTCSEASCASQASPCCNYNSMSTVYAVAMHIAFVMCFFIVLSGLVNAVSAIIISVIICVAIISLFVLLINIIIRHSGFLPLNKTMCAAS